MLIGKKDQTIEDIFSVIDADNVPIEGIKFSELDIHLYGPSGGDVIATHPIFFMELGRGSYKVSFMPSEVGLYYLTIAHSIYFPAGKGGQFQIFSDDLSSIGTMVSLIKDFTEGRWRIDSSLNQMIFYRADNTTEIARFNLYDGAGNPAIENIFDRQKA